MNKRLMEFLKELLEENDELESRNNSVIIDNEIMVETLLSQKKEIKELKAKLRQLKKRHKDEQINDRIIN